MIVRHAMPTDAGAIYDLMDRSPRQRVHLGHEDIAAAIATERFLLLMDDDSTSAQLLAFLVTLAEERPPSMPDSAPARIFVRGVAFHRHLSPTVGMQHLLHAFAAQSGHAPLQLIAYGGEGWLDRALRSAGMTLAEQVQYFALERLQKRDWPSIPTAVPCVIRDATPADLAELALLDGGTFDPLWHYSRRHLQDALMQGPLLVAQTGDELIGYSALLLERDTCTIARLAVHPDRQGQGFGRAMMLAGLHLGQEWGCGRAVLNTQATNHRSQQLYRSLGFRPTGESFAVFVLDVPAVIASLPHISAAEARV